MWTRSRSQSAFYFYLFAFKALLAFLIGIFMLGFAFGLFWFLITILSPRAYGFDANHQWDNQPPEIRAWFRAVKSRMGIPCCDVADGHRTQWQAEKDGTFLALIEGKWVKVPADAVILGARNPTGESIVWYTQFADGSVFIRCFVPADGA